ncbi:unnamed protein product [Musa hybrid cultivar]
MAGDRKIGVALDFSSSSKRALQWAIDNLLDPGETLIVLHVVRPKSFFHGAGSKHSSDARPLIPLTERRELDLLKSYDLEVDTDVHDMLEAASKQKEAKIVMKLYMGDAREKLCEAAQELKLDSLVMGCRGLTQIQRIFLGSVSNYVLSNVSCPVTVIKDTNFKRR